MALTSSRLAWLPGWSERRQGRRYRSYLLEGNVLVRSTPLLPHLERLPLLVRPLCDPAAPPIRLAEALAAAPRLRLVGHAPSGNRLAMRQLCLAWAQGNSLPDARVPLLYAIPPQNDAAPLELLRHELGTLGFDHDPLIVKRTLAAGLWLFLLEGWERLNRDERRRWRGWLERCAERFPALSAVISMPPEEPPLHLFEDWTVCDWNSPLL